MAVYRLDVDDELPHPPTADPNFNESVYLNGFDPEGRFGGWMRIGNRVNEGHAELQVCLYLPDGRIACQFKRPDIAANAGFAVAGLEYSVVEPLRRVGMVYRGDVMLVDDPTLLRRPRELFRDAPKVPCEVEFAFEGTSEVHGGEPVSADQPTMYGRDFSLGHFNQHGTNRGHITVGDQRWSLDGCGWRDHSWGPRYWTNINYYRLFIANFGPGQGLMLLKITGREGHARRWGVLQVDGQYEEITDLDVMTEWSTELDPSVIQLNVRTPRRAARLRGEVVTLAPLSNRRRDGDEELRTRIAEGFTHWDWDGRFGVGVTEYIERVVDGRPVGYPL